MMLDLHDCAARLHEAVQGQASAEDRLAAVSALAMELVYELTALEERLARLESAAAE